MSYESWFCLSPKELASSATQSLYKLLAEDKIKFDALQERDSLELFVMLVKSTQDRAFQFIYMYMSRWIAETKLKKRHCTNEYEKKTNYDKLKTHWCLILLKLDLIIYKSHLFLIWMKWIHDPDVIITLSNTRKLFTIQCYWL